ncbi:Txe/YoeB family addiction module toxin [Mariprofundus sp. EBB-1]|uniref:Txe/YoeB family addiction module toxin n=1 Tax=Mariprofundus sp. EBB-1 TaxID=2650971 RepID=UPI000EF18A9B|nr:Txe/YoeB family addiction module toxin [Mariprofundus sp. EBB-1]RLL54029.1 Txe/YoeB family addiction module toxin [Mariprofundus sp. EBB-1]
MSWDVILSKQAVKDLKKIKQAGLALKTRVLLEKIQQDPFVMPPRYESLIGNLKGFYSRRINIQHRLVYSVDSEKKVIHILRCWTHYE